jgi:hypothetical protein
VTRVLQVSRQSVYRPIARRPVGAGPGRGQPGDELIVEVAKSNPTDGTRIIAALASGSRSGPVMCGEELPHTAEGTASAASDCLTVGEDLNPLKVG